jgi:hypothetical protein
VSLVVDHPAERPGFRLIGPTGSGRGRISLPLRSLYRHRDARPGERACRHVHPHEVLIANGWLAADDYYRALAETCGTFFKPVLAPTEAVPPTGRRRGSASQAAS